MGLNQNPTNPKTVYCHSAIDGTVFTVHLCAVSLCILHILLFKRILF